MLAFFLAFLMFYTYISGGGGKLPSGPVPGTRIIPLPPRQGHAHGGNGVAPHEDGHIHTTEKEKEKKMRVETKTWGLNNEDLSFETQLNLLNSLFNKNYTNNDLINRKHISMIVSHIKAKICGYNQQDILKGKFLETEFVSFTDVSTPILFE